MTSEQDRDHLLVISRRTAKRIALVAVAVVLLAGVGVGAYLVGRSSAPSRQNRSSRSNALSAPAEDTEDFTVPSTSMYPTLKAGGRLVVKKLAFHQHLVSRGDIVVFRTPSAENAKCGGSPAPHLVKRVVGLPNESISARGGTVYVTTAPLAEPWLPKVSSTYTSNFGPIHIPSDEYFVMGDNRVDSCDSRIWGPVKRSAIVGKVVKVIPSKVTSGHKRDDNCSDHDHDYDRAAATDQYRDATDPAREQLWQGRGLRPTSLYWCSSECSSYMTDITWSTWGSNSASGFGTLVTMTTTPRTGQTFVSCATAVPIHHPGTPAVLSDPEYETVCPEGGGAQRFLLYTSASWWTDSSYALIPQSCS